MSSPKVFDSSSNAEIERPERVIILNRSTFWAQIFAGSMVAVGIGVGIWVALARFDRQVVVTGKLEQQGVEKPISAPSAGVVEVQVHNGDLVTAEQSLIKFKPTAPVVDVTSLQQEEARLIQENQIYEDSLKGGHPSGDADTYSLPKLRTELLQENQYYQALTEQNLTAPSSDIANQQRLLAASTPELQSQAAIARSQLQESEKQLSQLQEKLAAAQKLLALNQDITQQLTQARDVAVPRQQYQRQQQEVLSNQATVDRLQGEQQQLSEAIERSRQQLQSTLTLAAQNVLNKVAQNQKRLTQIDSSLRQAQQRNLTRIAEIEAELKQRDPQEQQLKSPVAGAVLDLQSAAPGAVVAANQKLLTIVPNDSWVASVLLRDRDLSSAKPGMDVDVRLTAWPNRELGSIQGKLIWVGATALPPATTRPYYAFPAKIQLQRPYLEVNGQPMRLQSDMLVQGEITLPAQQTVLDVMRDRLAKKVRVDLSFN